jgi:hypothetical protein
MESNCSVSSFLFLARRDIQVPFPTKVEWSSEGMKETLLRYMSWTEPSLLHLNYVTEGAALNSICVGE